MTPERFSVLVEAYGGAPARWPESERAAALAYIARTPAAQAQLDAACRLDALLERVAVPAPAPDLAALVAGATRQRQEAAAEPVRVLPFAARPARRPAVIWARAVALAAAGICGFIVGMSSPNTTGSAGTLDLYNDMQVEDTAW